MKSDKGDLPPDKKKRRNRARSTPLEVKAAIVRMVVEGGNTNAAEIHKALLRDQGLAPLQSAIPTERTVAREVTDILEEFKGADKSGPWSPGTHSGGTPVVLAALAAVIEHTEGRTDTVSIAEAECIARLERVVPDLAPLYLWYVARFYISRATRGDDTKDLDALLAFAFWRDEEAAARYRKAVRAGVVTPLPYALEQTFRSPIHSEHIALDDPASVDDNRESRAKRQQFRREWHAKMQPIRRVLEHGGRIRIPVGDHDHWVGNDHIEHCDADWRCRTDPTTADESPVSNPVSNE